MSRAEVYGRLWRISASVREDTVRVVEEALRDEGDLSDSTLTPSWGGRLLSPRFCQVALLVILVLAYGLSKTESTLGEFIRTFAVVFSPKW
jgi:hypothetical protein